MEERESKDIQANQLSEMMKATDDLRAQLSSARKRISFLEDKIADANAFILQKPSPINTTCGDAR